MNHIDNIAYNDLNAQIRTVVETMDEGVFKTRFYGEDDRFGVVLDVELDCEITERPFTDDAWGATKLCTEKNRKCKVSVLKVIVLDENGKIVRSDFDNKLIEGEICTSEWK